ncbi:mitochondrial ATP synthase epsilon chain-domain-containing protein [Entophlyctis helioformis]|nr:mitochondrial ATP synthase epsilon chain-domain-containing protein [Entophlyctis helioformis]
MSYWRKAGFSYLKYSNITATALRSVLKSEAKAAAAKREDIALKQAIWKDGKSGENKFVIIPKE